jgi:hypothetical protein
MRLFEGNKLFVEWWNHWMSRIHSEPKAAEDPTPGDAHVPAATEFAENTRKPAQVNRLKIGRVESR